MPAPSSTGPQQKSMVPLTLVGSIVLLAAGAFGGYIVAQKKYAQEYQRGYDSGYAAAKAKAEVSGIFAGPTEQLLVSGTVKSVGDGYIDMETPPIRTSPFEEAGPMVRRVLVTSETEIVLITEKTPEEIRKENERYEQERDAWLKSAADGQPTTPPPPPPSPFNERKIRLSEVKEGMIITATAATDISKAETFAAVRIEVREQAVLAQPVPPGGIQPGTPLPPAPPSP